MIFHGRQKLPHRLRRLPPVVDELMINFEHKVVGKGRPRFRRAGDQIVVYMEPQYVENKVRVQQALDLARLQLNRTDFFNADRVFGLRCVFWRRRPKMTKAKTACYPYGSMAKGAPDIDNAMGTIQDACERLIYVNDSQIAEAQVLRAWGKIDGASIQFVQYGEYST